MPEFLAVDGEAINDKYALLAASDGTHVLDMNELSTQECFEYLISKDRPKRVIVCFGLNYDVNMWIKDLDREALVTLWTEGRCVYSPPKGNPYMIEWIPAHWLKITKRHHKPVWIYEVWGFFQSSFVKALDSWGFETPDDIVTMKAQRGEFTRNELEKIISYCKLECTNLVRLMNALSAACEVADIVPKQWMGAGSLASALLGKRKWVRPHHSYDSELGPDECKNAILCAYFGGRVEMLKQGVFDWVSTSDIRSAYPYAITQLPSLRNARLQHHKFYNGNYPHAIWRVKWDDIPKKKLKHPNQKFIMPFPVRNHKDIYYPTSGVGWYHACEVEMAMKLGYPITILEGWCLKKEDDTYPFLWVKDIYDLRNKWKKEGIAAEKVLKLSLNSIYGKLAQGMGYVSSPSKYRGKEPPLPKWQSYFWAGEITARTRSRMLEAAIASFDPMMFATDGLFCEATPLEDDSKLGGWELTEYSSLFVARPGVYMAEKEDGSSVVRSRGFNAREVDFHELQQTFESDGIMGSYVYESKRFIGIGTALMRTDFSVWKTWETKPRKITFMPSAKHVDLSTNEIYPFDEPLPESEPYEPKTKKSIEESQINSQEQPLVVI